MSADVVTVTKAGETETVIAGSFGVSRFELFDALTKPERLRQWLRAGPMALVEVEVDGRPGGSFRYVFQRSHGPRIEVRGAYVTFDRPNGFSYVETYDFSPLRIDVITRLDEVAIGTAFTQTLTYASTNARDEDFEGVAASSREAYGRLAQQSSN